MLANEKQRRAMVSLMCVRRCWTGQCTLDDDDLLLLFWSMGLVMMMMMILYCARILYSFSWKRCNVWTNFTRDWHYSEGKRVVRR